MNECEISIQNAQGETRAERGGHLVFAESYNPGDRIVLTVHAPGYYIIQLDDAMGEELVYMKETTFALEVPFGEQHVSYSPRAFVGEMHYLAARAARAHRATSPAIYTTAMATPPASRMRGQMSKRAVSLFLLPATRLTASSAPKATANTPTKAGASTAIRRHAGRWNSAAPSRPKRWC